jgi:putative DNA primase/helicase
LGRPVATWTYRDTDGSFLFQVWRFDFADGRKEFRPLSFIGGVWRWQAPLPPRPLYGLDRLAAAPDAPVVVCEGEKAADAAQRLFPDYVATTSLTGAKGDAKADWTALKGRAVTVWPDSDAPGRKYAERVAALLVGLKCQVSLLDVARLAEIDGDQRGEIDPNQRSEHLAGWDAADAIREWSDLGALRRAAEELIEPWRPEKTATSSTQWGDAEREAIARLTGGEFALFVEQAKLDVGFVHEPETVAALNALKSKSQADYERLAVRLKKEARVRLATLESAMRAQAGSKGETSDGLPGKPLKFDVIEPWSEPVDGAALLTELSGAIGAYVVMDAYQRDACALWAVFAHAHDLRDYAPLLIAKSAIKRCGKSRLAEVLERLTPRPLFIAGLTAPFIERAIEDHRCTLIVDEADRIRKGDSALAERIDAQLNRSFKRQGARVGKNVPLPGGGYEPRIFSTWAPTFIAGIGDQADTAEDRAVIAVLKRKLPAEKVKPLRGKDGADLIDLARKIARWVADNESRLRAHDPLALDVGNDRAKDVWEPLLVIADVAGGIWPDRAREAGVALVGAGEEAEDNLKVMLLGDIRELFLDEFPTDHAMRNEGAADEEERRTGRYGPRLASADIVKRLLGLEDRPYGALGRAQKPLTQNMLGRLLNGFDIRPGPLRLPDGRMLKGYYLRTFEDAFARYLPALEKSSQSANPPTPSSHNRYAVTTSAKPRENEVLQPSQQIEAYRTQNPGDPNVSAGCDGVTDVKQENGGLGVLAGEF